MSNRWLKGEEKRKVTFKMGQSEAEIDCVDKIRTQTIHAKCERNPGEF